MNAKLILIVAKIAISLGASSASNADSYRGQYRYYDSSRSGLSLHFGYRSGPVVNNRYGYSSNRRNDSRYCNKQYCGNRNYNNSYYNNRVYNNRSYSNGNYDNRSYQSNNYCPGYGAIYNNRLNRSCYSHEDHYHCD
jgi:hypothetical protein